MKLGAHYVRLIACKTSRLDPSPRSIAITYSTHEPYWAAIYCSNNLRLNCCLCLMYSRSGGVHTARAELTAHQGRLAENFNASDHDT